jgi:mannosyltransferase
MRDPASAAEMGQRGRERVLAKFSLDAEAAAIAEIYRTLV